MKRHAVFIVFVGAVLLIFLYGVMGLLSLGRRTPSLTVTVILSESTSDRFRAFREGLEMAAGEENVVLDVVSTVRFASLEEECALISREVLAGCDALVVEPVSGENPSLVEEAAQGKPVVFVSSDLPETSYPWVGVDGKALGEALAQEFEKDAPEEAVRIGVLSGNQGQPALKECLTALREALSRQGREIAWELNQRRLHAGENLSLQMETRGADVLFCLDNDASEAAVDYLSKTEKDCLVYGVGRSEKAIFYLDSGLIRCLAVPDEYSMGYLCIKELVSPRKGEGKTVDVYMARKENLFSPETELILFPMVK